MVSLKDKFTKMQKIKKIIPLALVSMPFLAMAKNITDIVNDITGIIDVIIPLLITLAVLMLMWGIVQFITAAGDEEKRKKGRELIIYGIIGLFVMVSIWGLVGILSGTFNLSTSAPTLPTYTPKF